MRLRLLIAALFVALLGAGARALEPDEILLVASHAPESKAFAEYYARQRGVPEANLVILEVPGQEQISRENYREHIAKPVREWLTKNDPDRKIKCLLTFWGMPLRVANREISDDDKAELKAIRDELKDTISRIGPLVRDIELLTKELDPSFKPPTTQTILPAQAVRVARSVERPKLYGAALLSRPLWTLG